jgi:restriction system protein
VTAPIHSEPYVNALIAEWDVRRLDWFQFEKLIALLFDAEGFVVQCFGGADAEGGIDLIATKGGIAFGVQCQHWKSRRVGIKEVRAFAAALQDRNLQHGFLVTLEGHTHAAVTFARRNNIELMSEATLRNDLDEVRWRLNPAFIELMNDERKICPKCESEMILRTANEGTPTGQQFWGCSKFPRCNFRMEA